MQPIRVVSDEEARAICRQGEDAVIDDLLPEDRRKLETQFFKRSLDEIWQETETFFSQRDPKQLAIAQADPHFKMALIFRWYLGLSSRWAVNGEKGREMDYQIWCGPAMGAFNDWVHGSSLEIPQNRHVDDIARHLLTGAANLLRVTLIKIQGGRLPAALATYRPDL